ncbi:MAG: PilN domain-containing protein [Thermodesulforhabdaceae bacterium]
MIRLNLLRERKIEKPKTLMWQFWLYILVIILELAITGAVWKYQDQKIKKLDMEKSQLDAEIKVYEKYDKILKDLQAKLNDVKKRTEVISGLTRDRDNVVRLLALMTILLPEDSMWFEEVRFSGNVVTIIGFAKSNETLVEFMRSLEKSSFAPQEDINLVVSRAEEYFGNVLRKFELRFKYKNFSQVIASTKEKQEPKKP